MKRNIRMENRIIQSTFKNFEGIYNASKKMMKAWEIKLLPISVFKQVISEAKMSEKTESVAVNDYNKKYNKVLDSLYTHMSTRTEQLGATGFPLTELRVNLNAIKTAFANSVEPKN